MEDRLYSNVIYDDLTNKQKEFIDLAETPNSKVFLTGCAGAGKTLLATIATLKLEERNQNVQFLVYTKMLEKFVRDTFKDTDHIDRDLEDLVQRFHKPRTPRISLWSKIKKMTSNELSKLPIDSSQKPFDTILVDECQDFQKPMVETVKAMSRNQIWLGDATQQIFGHAMSKENEGYSSLYKDANYQRIDLDTNFRNPLTVAMLAMHFITLNEFDKISLEEKVSKFIQPITNNQTGTSQARNQPTVFIEADDEGKQYDAIAQRIKNIQNNKLPGTTNQIVVAHVHSKNVYKIRKELYKRGIEGELAKKKRGQDMEDNFDFKDDNLVLFGTIHSLKGLEFDYLFFPDTEEDKLDFNSMFEDSVEDNSYSKGYTLSKKQQDSIVSNTLFMLFTRVKKRIFISYVDKVKSLVLKNIPEEYRNLDEHFSFIKANENVPELSNSQVQKKVQEVEKSLKENNWPVQRKSSKELQKDLSRNLDDDLPF